VVHHAVLPFAKSLNVAVADKQSSLKHVARLLGPLAWDTTVMMCWRRIFVL
jgi:hypothetical protein